MPNDFISPTKLSQTTLETAIRDLELENASLIATLGRNLESLGRLRASLSLLLWTPLPPMVLPKDQVEEIERLAQNLKPGEIIPLKGKSHD